MAKSKGKRTRTAPKRRPKLNLFTAALMGLEFLDDALILISVGELLSDYAERGVDPMLAESANEAAFKVVRAGAAAAEAKVAVQALKDDLERLFAREQGLH